MRIAMVILAAFLAVAASVVGSQPAGPLLSGSEIRRDAALGMWRRYEVLHLAPDGTLTGNYESTRPVRGGNQERLVGDIKGRWSLQGGLLCFEGSGLEYQGQSCYALTKGGYSRNEYSASHPRFGDIWRFFIYPGK